MAIGKAVSTTKSSPVKSASYAGGQTKGVSTTTNAAKAKAAAAAAKPATVTTAYNSTKSTPTATTGAAGWAGPTPTSTASAPTAIKVGTAIPAQTSSPVASAAPAKTETATMPPTVDPQVAALQEQQAEAIAKQLALDKIATDPRIPNSLRDLFRRVVEEWDPAKELNIENILTTFSDIKQKTIDPYFAEQTKQFVNDLKKNLNYYNQNDALENEDVARTQQQNIKNTQGNLEAAGLTFSGQGLNQLGRQSAYSPDARASVLSTPFGGQNIEGLVPQANRLLASSTALVQKKRKDELARQAEMTLGSQGLQNQNLGLNSLNDVTQGSIAANQQNAYGQVLTGTWNQGQQLAQYANPVNLFNS